MGEEISALPPQAERLAKKGYHEFTAKDGRIAEIGNTADATFLNRKSDQPVGQHAYAIHHEVHHHSVVSVLGPAQTGLDDRKSRLHKHDQKAGDQCPDEIDGNLVLADLVGDIANGEALRLGGFVGDGVSNRNVRDITSKAAIRVAVSPNLGIGRRDAF